MTFTPHRSLQLLLAAGLVASLAACSGGSDNNTENNATENNSAENNSTENNATENNSSENNTSTEDMSGDADMGGDEDMGEEGLAIPEGCNPVAFEHDCLFPYPSDHFLVEDASMPSGKRVQLTEAAKMVTGRGETFDFMDTHPVDGFSHHQPIVAFFGEGLDDEGLTFHTDDPMATLEPTSTTLLIRADTGEPVAHWAELDRFTEKPEEQTLLLRTFTNLEHETRYIVAIQGLKGSDGEAIEAPQGFRQLRDGEAADDPTLAAVSERYERDIFPALDTLGVERSELTLAWDFTTQSQEINTRDMLAMRADLMMRLEENPPAVTVDRVIEDHNDHIALRIEGTIEVPLYLESYEVFALINRGEDGLPEANGTAQVAFTLQVPYSAVPESAEAEFTPAPIMQYGHGFFGSREEINYGSFMRGYSDERRYVTASVDWFGMSEAELQELPSRITGSRPGESLQFIDGIHQGMMNFIALSHALETTMTELDELKRFDRLLYDPERLYYYGISQGHILGTAFFALSPHIERGVLSVGGAPFSFMMSRSSNFNTFLFLIRTSFGGYLDVQKFITLSQHSFDRVDPSTYAPHILTAPFDGAPADRRVLLSFGYWDHSVPILAGLNLARMTGAPLLAPAPKMPYGLEAVEGPIDGSAAVLFDYMTEDPPGFYAQTPTNEQLEAVEQGTNVHEAVRHSVQFRDQIDAFLQPGGQIEHFCDGPCDPE